MSRQPPIPNPLHLLMLSWAMTATYTSMFMLGVYAEWVKATRQSAPEDKGEVSSMTPEEEELLLHLVD